MAPGEICRISAIANWQACASVGCWKEIASQDAVTAERRVKGRTKQQGVVAEMTARCAEVLGGRCERNESRRRVAGNPRETVIWKDGAATPRSRLVGKVRGRIWKSAAASEVNPADELTKEEKEMTRERWTGRIGVQVAADAQKDWWLMQACKELRTAEADWTEEQPGRDYAEAEQDGKDNPHILPFPSLTALRLHFLINRKPLMLNIYTRSSCLRGR